MAAISGIIKNKNTPFEKFHFEDYVICLCDPFSPDHSIQTFIVNISVHVCKIAAHRYNNIICAEIFRLFGYVFFENLHLMSRMASGRFEI